MSPQKPLVRHPLERHKSPASPSRRLFGTVSPLLFASALVRAGPLEIINLNFAVSRFVGDDSRAGEIFDVKRLSLLITGHVLFALLEDGLVVDGGHPLVVRVWRSEAPGQVIGACSGGVLNLVATCRV